MIKDKEDKVLKIRSPEHMTVCKICGRVYVADWSKNREICIRPDGSIVFIYRHLDLVNPAGICLDDSDNLMVCGHYSHNVHRVDHLGNFQDMVFSNTLKDDAKEPMSVACRSSEGNIRILIGSNSRSDRRL